MQMPYDDPEDTDDLRLCLQATKDDYESCIEDFYGLTSCEGRRVN